MSNPDERFEQELEELALTPPANTYQHGGDHYRKRPIQHWDFVLANDIPYMEAQIIKYVFRWRDKNGLQDLEKAQHFLAKLIEYEKSKRTEPLVSGLSRECTDPKEYE